MGRMARMARMARIGRIGRKARKVRKARKARKAQRDCPGGIRTPSVPVRSRAPLSIGLRGIAREQVPEGSRTPVSSLEDWCLDRSATKQFPAGESNSALWVKGPVHHASMLARGAESAREESNLRDPAYQAGACTSSSATGGKSGGAARTTFSGSTTPRSTG